MLDQHRDLVDELVFLRHAFEKAAHKAHALLCVARRAHALSGFVALAGRTGGGFSEIVSQHGAPDHEVFARTACALARKGVEGVGGVDPHVALGMKLRVLGAADQRL